MKYFPSYVLGVIPGHSSPNMMEWLFEQDNVVVAVHGSVHEERYLDEFQGMNYQSILIVLRYVMNTFSRHNVTSVDYIPPHNTINKDTVLALKELGFKNVYGGPETSSELKEFIVENGLSYVHSEPPLEYGRSDELVEHGAVEYLNREAKNKDVWLTLHWPWEANLSLKFEPLISFLSQLNKDILS